MASAPPAHQSPHSHQCKVSSVFKLSPAHPTNMFHLENACVKDIGGHATGGLGRNFASALSPRILGLDLASIRQMLVDHISMNYGSRPTPAIGPHENRTFDDELTSLTEAGAKRCPLDVRVERPVGRCMYAT